MALWDLLWLWRGPSQLEVIKAKVDSGGEGRLVLTILMDEGRCLCYTASFWTAF